MTIKPNELLALIGIILLVIFVFLSVVLSKDDPDAPKLSLAAIRMIRYEMALLVGDEARRTGKQMYVDFKGRPSLKPPPKDFTLKQTVILTIIFYGCYIWFLHTAGIIL